MKFRAIEIAWQQFVYGTQLVPLPSGKWLLIGDNAVNYIHTESLKPFVGYTEQGEALYAGDVYFTD